MRASLPVAAAALAACALVVAASEPQPASPVTRAASGRVTYLATCAGCHLPDRSGRNEAPSLANADFASRWTGRPGELAAYIQKTMPPTDAGSLTDEAAADLAAYLLAPDAADAVAQNDATPRSTTRTGVIVSGEVKNYAPVTDGDAAQPARGRLADGAAELSGLELQPARRDHARERQESEARLGVGDERRWLERADAARPRRHRLPREYRQRHPGARRRFRRSHLGKPHRS